MTSSSVFSTMNGVTSLGIADPKSRLSEPPIHWWKQIEARLKELSRLDRGWDGYDGVPMRFEVGAFARDLLSKVYEQSPYPPQLIPGSDGCIQIEWHHKGNSIELDIRDVFDFVAWRKNAATGPSGEEHHLTNDFTIINYWLKDFFEMTTRNAASAA
jgi:hypothetical protein